MTERETPQFNSGAILHKPYYRDFKFEKAFGIVTEDIPDNYSLRPYIKVKDQKSSDMCSSFGTSILADLHEGVETDPLYLFAKIKQIEGNLDWGAAIVSGMQALVKYGALEQLLSPYTLENKTRDFLANWANWPEVYDTFAKKHQQKSYYAVKNGFDYFKSALWLSRNKKNALLTGVMWQTGWQEAPGGIVDFTGKAMNGHIVAITGFKKINGVDYLEIVNSYNTTVGDGGFYYFRKDIVNKYFNWGTYIAVDMSPAESKALVWGTKEKIYNAIAKTLELLMEKINQLYAKTQSNL